MGQVEEYFDKLRRDEFLAGRRESPFSLEDIRWAKWIGVDLVRAEEKRDA